MRAICPASLTDQELSQLIGRVFDFSHRIPPISTGGMISHHFKLLARTPGARYRVSQINTYLNKVAVAESRSDTNWTYYERHLCEEIPHNIGYDVRTLAVQMAATSDLYRPDTDQPFTEKQMSDLLKDLNRVLNNRIKKDEHGRVSPEFLFRLALAINKGLWTFRRDTGFDQLVIKTNTYNKPLYDKIVMVGDEYVQSVVRALL